MMGLRTQFVHLWVCDQTEKSNDTFEDSACLRRWSSSTRRRLRHMA